jgi:hypothetical protein
MRQNSWDRFLNIFAKKFKQKLAKIAEICDHNIDPWAQTAMTSFTTDVNFEHFGHQ